MVFCASRTALSAQTFPMSLATCGKVLGRESVATNGQRDQIVICLSAHTQKATDAQRERR